MQAAPKYQNPWSNTDGFVDLGPHELNGVHYDLYCMPRHAQPGITDIGARFGDDGGSYRSASLQSVRKDGAHRVYCYGSCGPIDEAIYRMVERGLIKVMVYDVDETVIPTNRSVQVLYPLWDRLTDVPVTDDGLLDESFEQFARGTDRNEVWHWFEAQNPDFIVGEVLQGKRHNSHLSR